MKTYTLQEVADILQLSRRTIYEHARTGKLNAVKIGRFWRVTEDVLNDFTTKGSGPKK